MNKQHEDIQPDSYERIDNEVSEIPPFLQKEPIKEKRFVTIQYNDPLSAIFKVNSWNQKSFFWLQEFWVILEIWYQNVFGTEMSPVPKCPGTEMSQYQNASGTEMSQYRNVSGTEMSRYRNVHGTEISQYRNVSGAEMSRGRNVPGTEMSLYRNVSGTEMSVPKCLMPKSLGPKSETAAYLHQKFVSMNIIGRKTFKK